MELKPEIFRQYDIRGKIGEDLTLDSVGLLGQGIGTYFRQRGVKEVTLGRDCRLSSPSLAEALSRGLELTGCQVIDLGTVPTPLLYFAVYHHNLESGVMITGSHNPPEYNGFKMMIGQDTLYGQQIQEIYQIIKSGQLTTGQAPARREMKIVEEYIDYVRKNISLARPLKIVVDAGNGTAGVIAVPLFKQLGCEVIPLYCEMDGHFPHHHPDPTIPEALQDLISRVKETKAEVGLAYDGDGDRIGVIDNQGNIIWGDKLMIIFCRAILPHHPGAAVISEVKASKLLYQEIERLGGRPIMWKTGHSLIKKKIKEEKALLAGEMSGHIFFADRWFGFDDAIYSSARLLEILSQGNQPLSQLLADLPPTYTTPEIRIYASDQVKFKIVDQVKRILAQKYPIIDIDGVRAEFPHGWALVRASNTQEVLVLRFEADTEAHQQAIQEEVEQVLREVIQQLENK
ncbi:MAG TPA: phosphomannomutase/phosphoglucomutase [Candidatus Aminicenantes bacterium]|nr:phosphomannomutase/phosphoglucomutase [Candidatus Aminicenantes bacterium]